MADWPLSGKCRRCHEPNHFVHDCPKPVWYMPGREDDPSSAPSVTPPLGGASASMEEPVNDTHVEYDAGKEVPACQASQSDLSGGGTHSVVEDVSPSSHVPLETSGGAWILTH